MSWLEAKDAPHLGGARLTLEQVVIVSRADLVEDLEKTLRRERGAAAVRTETDVVVKLISPCEACVRREVHGRENKYSVPDMQGQCEQSTNCRWWDSESRGHGDVGWY